MELSHTRCTGNIIISRSGLQHCGCSCIRNHFMFCFCFFFNFYIPCRVSLVCPVCVRLCLQCASAEVDCSSLAVSTVIPDYLYTHLCSHTLALSHFLFRGGQWVTAGSCPKSTSKMTSTWTSNRQKETFLFLLLEATYIRLSKVKWSHRS